MTQKIYRTSQGQTVDLGALILKNENVPAVGNMNVNAAGKPIPKQPTVVHEPPRQPTTHRPVPPGRRTNVTRQEPDTSSRAARARLQAEQERQRAIVSAQFIPQVPIAPMVEEAVATPSTPEVPAVIDPLAISLDTPVKSGGLADAISRVQSGDAE